MKAPRKLLLLSAVASLTSGATALAEARDAQPAAGRPSDNQMAEVVVTARRREERLQDVPISITVYNQAEIADRNIVSAGDLAKYTPSLFANSRYGSESTSFAIRGFIQDQNTSPSVAVYFADVVAPRANGGTTAGNGAGVGSFFDLENVEVLKGPQGTLFGRNTTGGAVLLVPQKPTDKFEGYVEGSLGDYNLVRTQAVVNMPLGDKVRARLGVDRETRDGYLHNVAGGIGPKDFGDVNYYSLRAGVVADLTSNIENYTLATYSNSDTHGFLAKPFIVVSPLGNRFASQIANTPGFYDVSNGNPYAHQNIEQWQLINTTTWNVTDTLLVKNIVSYAQFRQRQASNIYGENGYDPITRSAFYSVAIIPPDGKYNVAESTFTEELQVQGRTGGNRLNYQGGIYLESANPLEGFQTTYSPSFVTCTNVLTFACSGSNATSVSQSKYWFRNFGVYAQATYMLTSQLNLTGGVRFTRDDTRGLGESVKVTFPSPNVPAFGCSQPAGLVAGGSSAQVQADNSLCDFRRESKSSRPTWLLDLDYKPVDGALLYVKYARGYRQGSVNVASYGLEQFGPEKVDTYELGAKTSWRGAVPGRFNLAAFYNNFTDQQVAVGLLACSVAQLGTPQCPFVPASASGIANAGKSKIQGVEVEAAINPFADFWLNASYTYLDTRIDSITLPATPLGFTAEFAPKAGGPIPFAAKNQYSVTASYTLPIDASLGRVTLASTFSHRDTALGSSSSAPAQQTLPAQNLVNLNLNWTDVRGKPVDLSLFVTNLTNEKFYLFTTGKSFGYDAYIANEPRMFGVRAKLRFGS